MRFLMIFLNTLNRPFEHYLRLLNFCFYQTVEFKALGVATLTGKIMKENFQLYSLNTPNGQKIGIVLEEMGLEYGTHVVDITKGEQFSEEFIQYNPNSKIPALVDLTGDNGKPLPIMESGAILLYLAEKTRKFLPTDSAQRSQVLQWLFFQMAGLGPMFGQFGHFHKWARDKGDQSYAIERYTAEARRLLTVIDEQLQKNDYIAGEKYSIADMAIVPWVLCVDVFYEGAEILDLPAYKSLNKWVKKIVARPAVKKGLLVSSL